MFGVVLWSDPRACRAVFWCEDQGDLAYYAADPLLEPEAAAFCAGDMVQFDVSAKSEYRAASNARLVTHRARETLQDDLKQTARTVERMRSREETSNIVALNLNDRPTGALRKKRSQRG